MAVVRWDPLRELEQMADRLNREWAGRGARVHAVEEYYRVVEGEYLRALKQHGFARNKPWVVVDRQPGGVRSGSRAAAGSRRRSH